MDSPPFVSEYLKAAHALLERGAVLEPIYSRGTYQIEVQDRNKPFFPYLQITDEGMLTDAFCSCALSERAKGCPHLAAAWLRIFNDTQEPLHVRFRKSLWNRLFQMASKRHGYEPSCLQKEGALFYCESKTKKRLFSIEGLSEEGRKRLQELLFERKEEESTIQFANLSVDEIDQWRRNEAGHLLHFELSFWSDCAQWLMWMADEKEPFTISFDEKKGELPHEITIRFDQVIVQFYISSANWPWIIPSLASVPSPLAVYDREEIWIERVHYDPEGRFLEIRKKESSQESNIRERSIVVGEWLYVEKEGFYRKRSDPMWEQGSIEEKEIGTFLTKHSKEVAKWLDVPIQLESLSARYQLFFDSDERLHIRLFALEEEDIFQPYAVAYLPWVYLPQKGFFHLQDLMFEELEKVIEKDLVAEFIDHHRRWLHQFPGFQTHFGSLQSHLTYAFTDGGDLSFGAQLDFPEHFEGAIDFGEWIYLRGQGFYMKQQSRGKLPLYPGLVVPKEEIGHFLQEHKEDLEQVQHFFASRSFLEKMGLALFVNAEDRIVIEPHREVVQGIDPANVRFYGSFAYLLHEGFFELPPASRLPERYQEKLVISRSQEAAFLAYELEPLKRFALSLDQKLKKPKQLHLNIRKVKREKRLSFGWLIDGSYVSEIGSVDLIAIWDAFQAKKQHLFSEAGLLFLKDVRFNWLRQITKRRIDRKKRVIRLNTLEWIKLSVFEKIEPPKGNDPESLATRELLEQIGRFETKQLLDVSRLQSTLRPYQEIGVQWLWFLYCHGLSGLLSDDMGLGKTHQAMALLAAISQGDRNRSQKYLVVCPTSVIYHWQDLLERFLPDLRVSIYYGIERSLTDFEEHYDLLLTSYGILRTGKEDLRIYSFELAIFDEIQIAKNASSQTHKALRSVRAQMRLGLTGTPIENRLRELKALFDLLLPNYFPTDALFREFFIHPIEKHQDAEKKDLLSKLVRPFILRRKKSEVLTDLPEKIEEIAYCDLSTEQQELYYNTSSQMREGVYRELKDETKPISYVHVFSALSTLKQICDHPSLLSKDLRNWSSHASGKWDLFVELLQEALDSKQKVVIFSQYLDMLAIIESYLKKKGIGFASIKGSTRNRKEQLVRFKEDPRCEVFVASLLAAGVGIDLTVASIVIHYDRWWNPAKENQATDRVHRMGQNRGVQVFKLVTKHTIEEDIHALIEKKKGLMEEIIGTDEADQISYLNRDELISIFEQIWRDPERS